MNGRRKFSGIPEAEHASEADRDIGIAGEPEIDLEPEARRRKPRRISGRLNGRQREDAIGGGAEDVAIRNSFTRPVTTPPDAVGKGRHADVAARELVG